MRHNSNLVKEYRDSVVELAGNFILFRENSAFESPFFQFLQFTLNIDFFAKDFLNFWENCFYTRSGFPY
jgi:hypothetical protein